MASYTLLTGPRNNPKLAKKHGRYVVAGLSLAQADLSGTELCPMRTPGCTAVCLGHQGRGTWSVVRRARIKKTRLWLEDPERFKALLVADLKRFEAWARRKRLKPVVRLNVYSDIVWERKFPELFSLFPDVQFYDYTKIHSRAFKLPANYKLAHSYDENITVAQFKDWIRILGLVVVFRRRKGQRLPEQWHGFPVVDGDKHDLRFLDAGPGRVIGLRAKGSAYKDQTGFVVDA